jgi:soluble lytic murein transglycosylase-like protein
VILSVLAACAAPGGSAAVADRNSAPGGAVATTVPAAPDGSAPSDQPDPAHFAAAVLRVSAPAGIDPRLLMAIVYNESYKPHDAASERLWQALNPNASLGIVNMHQAAFDQARHGRPFSNRQWQELPDDPELALQAAAWYLHDLAKMLPAAPKTTLTHDELLALGYNTGPSNMRLFARGVPPGPMAQTYLVTLNSNWEKAGAALANAAKATA